MKLTPPKKITFFIALILGVAGIVGQFAGFAVIGFWLAIVGLALLLISCCFKGI